MVQEQKTAIFITIFDGAIQDCQQRYLWVSWSSSGFASPWGLVFMHRCQVLECLKLESVSKVEDELEPRGFSML